MKRTDKTAQPEAETWVNGTTGSPIAGVLGQIYGTAWVSGFEADGTPVYVGESEVDWNSQVARRDPKTGSILVVDEAGKILTLDTCVPASLFKLRKKVKHDSKRPRSVKR
jgi:hypothetical protein